jgi:hypothetical protein
VYDRDTDRSCFSLEWFHAAVPTPFVVSAGRTSSACITQPWSVRKASVLGSQEYGVWLSTQMSMKSAGVYPWSRAAIARNGAYGEAISTAPGDPKIRRYRAAEEGLPTTQLPLAQLYAARRVGPKDLVHAYMWFLIASEQITRAKNNINKSMTMEQLLEAEASRRVDEKKQEDSAFVDRKSSQRLQRLISKGRIAHRSRPRKRIPDLPYSYLPGFPFYTFGLGSDQERCPTSLIRLLARGVNNRSSGITSGSSGILSSQRDVLLVKMASDMSTSGTNCAALGATHVWQRPGYESLFFSSRFQFSSCGGDLGSSCLDKVVRRCRGRK